MEPIHVKRRLHADEIEKFKEEWNKVISLPLTHKKKLTWRQKYILLNSKDREQHGWTRAGIWGTIAALFAAGVTFLAIAR